MTWSLTLEPLLPGPWLWGLALVAAAMMLPILLRRFRGGWLRAAAALALIAALANPVLVNEDREPLSTVVALVADNSASQGLDGRDAVTEAAHAALEERFGRFGDIELRVVEAGSNTSGIGADGTNLFGPLATALGDVPPERIGAVVMVTDGQVHDAPADAGGLPTSAPIHVLLTGHDNERDRRIVIDAAPRFGIVNERQVIRYRVVDDGAEPGTPVEVIVSTDGEPQTVVVVGTGLPAEIAFDVTHGGTNVLELEAAPLDDELTDINNRAIVAVEGIRENLRVLLVSGEPHAGERTWRNLLKSDAAVDLVHFTILRPPSKQDGTPINQLSLIAFPTRELFSEKIDEFDLIIFDRYHHRGVLPLLYFDNITRYVREGGALLVAAGPDYADLSSIHRTPLAPVLPVAPTGTVFETPYHARVTDVGHRHPVTRSLEGADRDPPNWGRFFRLVDVQQQEGSALMSGLDDHPLLVLNREQEGRVAILLSDHTWLWARGFEGGGPHVDLLRRLAHWLMKEPDLEEEALHATARGSDLVVERQTMLDATGPMSVLSPSGAAATYEPREVETGLWRATAPADEIGLYRIEQGELKAFAHNGPANPREFLDAHSTGDLLRPLVGETRGSLIRISDADGSLNLPRIVPIRSGATLGGADWVGIRMSEASVLKGISRVPLLTGFGGIAGIAGLLGLLVLLGLPFATWLREGR